MNLNKIKENIILSKNNRNYKLALSLSTLLCSDDKIKLNNTIKELYGDIVQYIQECNLENNIEKVKDLYLKIFNEIPIEEKKIRNIILNEYEIALRKIQLDSFPRLMELFLTSKCNLKCIMCGGEQNKYSLPDNEFSELIGMLPYLQYLSIRGGEVFFDKRTECLLENANKNNVKLEIITNGLLLNEKIINNLIDNKCNLAVSIDSINKEIYESIRVGAKFENLIANLDLLNKIRNNKKTKISLTLHMVVMKRNYNEIEKIIDFAHKYQFDHLTIIPISGNNAGDENFFDYKTDNKIIEELAAKRDYLFGLAKEYGIILHSRLPQKKYNFNIIENTKNVVREEKKLDNNIHCYLPFRRLFLEGIKYKPRYICMDLDENNDEISNSIVKKWNSKTMMMYRQNMILKKYDSICNSDCFKNKFINSNRKMVLL